MPIANLENADIAYVDEGEGYPVLLIHGFASNARINWVAPGWFKVLNGAGFRVLALDNRGHGESTKFYEQDDYVLEKFASDAIGLLDHLAITECHLMGYSMGSRISSILAYKYPERFRKLVLAGNGYNMIEGGFDSSDIHDGLAAGTSDEVTTQIGREFRFFAEQTGSDLKALAACIMGGRSHIPREVFENIPHQVLVAVGTEDTVALDGGKLAKIIPNGRFLPLPGRNHMNAVGDSRHKKGVLEFLGSAG